MHRTWFPIRSRSTLYMKHLDREDDLQFFEQEYTDDELKEMDVSSEISLNKKQRKKDLHAFIKMNPVRFLILKLLFI